MPLRFKYQSKDQVPAEHQSLYVERDGAFFLDAEGVVEKSKADELRTSHRATAKQLEELKTKYEGIDPDSVKTLLAEKAKLEDEKLVKAGEVEKLIEKRVKASVSDSEKRAVAAEQQLSALTARMVETEISRAAVESALKLGLQRSAIQDLQARAQKTFKIVEGAAKAFEADGITPAVGQDGVSPLTFDEWAARQVVAAPHLFESSAGGGATGNTSGGAISAANPFRKGADWNVTEQMRMLKTNPALAARLKASA